MNKKMYHYTDGGLNDVWLQNGFEIRSTPYGKGVAIHDVEGLTKAICLALVAKSNPLSGIEFRYIRSGGMLLSQAGLGVLMGVDAKLINNWEGQGCVPNWAGRRIRALYEIYSSNESR